MTAREIINAVLEISDTGQGDQLTILLDGQMQRPQGDLKGADALGNLAPCMVAMIGALLGRLPEIAECVLHYHESDALPKLPNSEEGRRALRICRETMGAIKE